MDYNLIHECADPATMMSVFGGFADKTLEDVFPPTERVIRFSDKTKFEDIAVTLQLFPSKTQARKNGWSGPIPKGYSERKFGKQHRFFIWGGWVELDEQPEVHERS